MSQKTITITNPDGTARHSGRTFRIETIEEGEAYGLSGRCIADAPMVQFIDMDVSSLKFPTGQHAASYYVSTILGYDRFGSRSDETGLDLQADVPVWTIDAKPMAKVRRWLRDRYRVHLALRDGPES